MDLVEKADGFAEAFPEYKYQVVEMLQQWGHLNYDDWRCSERRSIAEEV